eukprot:TRINITY_DN33699_c0_g1_i1.p1 TRINITY_DN33699_c0_g1~~TRINITY_DN33699_c0_g1_i1.p1  ORF type:complete len:637 (-),score=95.87 TRINITY_DN33699_c0_g1_i1:159-2069(-)
MLERSCTMLCRDCIFQQVRRCCARQQRCLQLVCLLVPLLAGTGAEDVASAHELVRSEAGAHARPRLTGQRQLLRRAPTERDNERADRRPPHDAEDSASPSDELTDMGTSDTDFSASGLTESQAVFRQIAGAGLDGDIEEEVAAADNSEEKVEEAAGSDLKQSTLEASAEQEDAEGWGPHWSFGRGHATRASVPTHDRNFTRRRQRDEGPPWWLTVHEPPNVSTSLEILHNHAALLAKCQDSLKVASVDTRRKSRTFVVDGAPGWTAHNAGAGFAWSYPGQTKPRAYEAWLQSVDPEDIVILMDDDVLSGGCSRVDVCTRYAELVRASGGFQVIVSAEMGLYPKTHKDVRMHYMQVRERIGHMLDALHLDMHLYKNKSTCNCPVGPCSRDRLYQYLNSGFIMGPAGKLLTIMSSLVETNGLSDQDGLTEYFFQHNKSLALDYAGLLSLSMHQIKAAQTLNVERSLTLQSQGGINVNNSRNNFTKQLASGGKVLRNLATNRVQCFMHFNGVAKMSLEWASDRKFWGKRSHKHRSLPPLQLSHKKKLSARKRAAGSRRHRTARVKSHGQSGNSERAIDTRVKRRKTQESDDSSASVGDADTAEATTTKVPTPMDWQNILEGPPRVRHRGRGDHDTDMDE